MADALGMIETRSFPAAVEAADAMVHEARVYRPDAARHQEYRFWVEQYLQLYPALKDIQHTVHNHLAD